MIDLDLSRWSRDPSSGQLLAPEAAEISPQFALSVLKAIEAGQEITAEAGTVVRFTATPALPRGLVISPKNIRRLPSDQANISIALDDRLVLKILQSPHPGIHPEIELGGFLLEAGFPNIAPLCGQVELLGEDSMPTALGLLHRFVPNSGTAADFMAASLERELRRDSKEPAKAQSTLPPTFSLAELIGRRSAALHLALGRESAEPTFGAETLRTEDIWLENQRGALLLQQSWAALESAPRGPGGADRRVMKELLARRQDILLALNEIPSLPEGAQKIRIHGDLHLGQVLLTGDDVAFVDFEGEPGRSLQEARLKHTPLRDVAAMLRSFAYVAQTVARNCAMASPEAEVEIMAQASKWRVKAGGAFLAGYEAILGASSLWMGDRAARMCLLQCQLLQRALFELAYEAKTRPEFLAIPASGILAALDERDLA